MVGYALHHEGDCYNILDSRTSTVYETQDIIWLSRMFSWCTSHEDKDDELQSWPDAVDPSETMVVEEIKEEEEAKMTINQLLQVRGGMKGITMKRV
eukprot:4064337-Ditylum_brightwellii.AAC.1